MSENSPALNFEVNRGELGKALERYYFHCEPNNRPEADLLEAGIITTPAR